MDKPMMECGHAANGKDSNGNPCCAICIGLDAGATKVKEIPKLEGRKARCSYYGQSGKYTKCCKSEKDSSTELAFFEYRPNAEFDKFYCGCWGWS